MDEITRRVQQMYTEFPLPNFEMPEMPSEADLAAMGPMHRLEYNYYICHPHFKSFAGGKMLDGGCGTGNSTYRYAVRNPEVEILGVDLSDKSIFLAESRAQKRGLSNVRFRQVDLMSPEALSAEGPFDFIASEGVVHHLSDPLTGLRHLVRRLSPDGLIFLAFYSEKSRARVAHFQQAIQLMLNEEEREDFGKGLVVAKRLFGSLARDGNLDPQISGLVRSDQEIVDTFLHASEHRYSLTQLFTLVDQAGLRPLMFHPGFIFDPEHWFSDPELCRRATALDQVSRWQLADLLIPRHILYQFFACRKDFHPHAPERTDEDICAAVPRFVPFVELETVTTLGRDGGFVEAGAGRLVFRDSLKQLTDIELGLDQLKLVRACDGHKSVAVIAEEAHCSGEEAAALFGKLEQAKAVYF